MNSTQVDCESLALLRLGHKGSYFVLGPSSICWLEIMSDVGYIFIELEMGTKTVNFNHGETGFE